MSFQILLTRLLIAEIALWLFSSRLQAAEGNDRWSARFDSPLNSTSPIYILKKIERYLYIGGGFEAASVPQGDGTSRGSGEYRSILRWDGTDAVKLPGPVIDDDFEIHAIAAYQGSVFFGGRFTRPRGIFANNIVRWDGTNWSALGAGTSGPVMALSVFESKLFVGGSFDRAGEQEGCNLAVWNGTEWAAMPQGHLI